ncbi:MAG: class I SAM-dependent methyltransferase [Phycisphaerae bacterium]|nr:class I SAM-dependent methyltransferase [Phycisphaerae bacterium]
MNQTDVKAEAKSQPLLKKKRCPGCGGTDISIFYKLQSVPVHSVLLMKTQKDALEFPRGDIELGYCSFCGFISNYAYDERNMRYSNNCEESQAFSLTFNKFHNRLAQYLIERYDLRNKTVIEIGCGKGDFLTMICHLGGNKGIGFDPAYVRGREPLDGLDIEFIEDFYSEKYFDLRADFICCKMTLEHIHKTNDFLSTVRNSIGDNFDTTVFFQIPDSLRVLSDIAFWDIYYEHCSYFSASSLRHLFESCGFEVQKTWTDYDDQYLMIEAKPSLKSYSLVPAANTKETADAVEYFTRNYQAAIEKWEKFLHDAAKENKKVVIWSGGSKAVSFLTAIHDPNAIEYVVDINTYRQGTFLAGSGQQIVAPIFLKKYGPDIVIVMNPVYRDEITASLDSMGVEAELLTV